MDDKPNDDIDPTLLLETGRASAIQDLSESVREAAEKADALASRGIALEGTLDRNIVAENRRFRRRNNVLLIGVAVLIIFSAFREWRSYYVTGPQLDRTEHTVTGPLSDANQK